MRRWREKGEGYEAKHHKEKDGVRERIKGLTSQQSATDN